MIFVWGIAILALALFFISSIKKGQSILGFNKFLASQSVNDLYSTFAMESEKLDDIRVSLISESLEIEKAEDDKITIELYGSWTKENEPNTTCKNNMLIIEQDKNSLYTRSLKLKLPEQCITDNTNINAKLVSGILKVTDFCLNKLDVENTSGLIEVKETTTRITNAKNVSGIIRVENCNFEDFNTENISGSIYANGNFNKINAKTVSGGVNVSTKKDFEADCNFGVVSGSITLDLPENINATFDCTAFAENAYIEHINAKGKTIKAQAGTGSYKITAKTESGSIFINKNK